MSFILIIVTEAELTGQPKFPIFPASKDEFYWKVVDARVKFVTDEKGIVTNVIHYQNGTQFKAMRLKDETPVAVNPAVFDKYIGKYDAGARLVILRLNKPLLILNEVSFKAKDNGTVVTFVFGNIPPGLRTEYNKTEAQST